MHTTSIYLIACLASHYAHSDVPNQGREGLPLANFRIDRCAERPYCNSCQLHRAVALLLLWLC